MGNMCCGHCCPAKRNVFDVSPAEMGEGGGGSGRIGGNGLDGGGMAWSWLARRHGCLHSPTTNNPVLGWGG